MKTQGEYIRTLQRRVDFLKAREYRNSYDAAELGALEWALVNLPPQPAQQEPFGYFRYDLRLDAWVQNREGRPGTAFYTSPPASKPWVGLTDEEILEAWCIHLDEGDEDEIEEWRHVINEAREIEAKLKEKNT